MDRVEHIKQRLKYLRGELRAERISYGELVELQTLAPHIDSGDTELLEWAEIPETPGNDRKTEKDKSPPDNSPPMNEGT